MSQSVEETHLYNLSLIPAGAVFLVFIGLFAYFLHSNSLRTTWDFFFFATPFWFLIIETVFLSFEVLYARRTNYVFNLKRLMGRTILTTAGFSLFIALLALVYQFKVYLRDDGVIVSVSAVTWFSIWLVLLIIFREKIDQLFSGKR